MTIIVKTMTQHTPTYKEVCRDCRYFTSPERSPLYKHCLVSYSCPYACHIIRKDGKEVTRVSGEQEACCHFEYSGQQWIIF